MLQKLLNRHSANLSKKPVKSDFKNKIFSMYLGQRCGKLKGMDTRMYII